MSSHLNRRKPWRYAHYAQSAMEYLMTYGWAILIIAVVLAALFQLGVFNGNNFSSTACLAQAGYICSQPVMNTSGWLGMSLGQVGSQTLNVTGIACTNSTSVPASFEALSLTLVQDQFYSQAVTCPVGNLKVGTAFKGYLWLQYSVGSQTSLVTQLGEVSAVISTSSPVGALPLYASGGTNASKANNLSISIPNGFSVYFCSGYYASPHSWHEDFGGSGISIGNQSTGNCSNGGGNNGVMTLAGVGVHAQAYEAAGCPGGCGSGAFGTSFNALLTVPSGYPNLVFEMTGYAPNGGLTSVTLPPGCTQVQLQKALQSGGSLTLFSYIAVCRSQSAGTYNVPVVWGSDYLIYWGFPYK